MHKELSIIALVLLVALGALYVYKHKTTNPDVQRPVITQEQQEVIDNAAEPEGLTSVKIAVLDTAGDTDGPARGCDKLVLVDQDIAPTAAPLSAALEELFSIESEDVDGWFNFIARTNDELIFESASVLDGVASIYLTGEAVGFAGVCDDPRPGIQIRETALQFPTVESVKIYLNGVEDDLAPDMM